MKVTSVRISVRVPPANLVFAGFFIFRTRLFGDAGLHFAQVTVSGTEAATRIIAGHELTHVLKMRSSSQYSALENYVMSLPGMDARLSAYMSGLRMSEADAKEELVADFSMREIFSDTKTAQEVTKKHSKLAEAIRNALRWIKTHIFGGEESEVDAAIRMWNNAYTDAARNKNSKDSKKGLADRGNTRYNGIKNSKAHVWESFELSDDFKQVYNEDRHAFLRSLANKTSGMKDGETRIFTINGANRFYIFEADGYMSGSILDSRVTADDYRTYKETEEQYLEYLGINEDARGSNSVDVSLIARSRRESGDFLPSENGAGAERNGELYGKQSGSDAQRGNGEIRRNFEAEKTETDEIVRDLKEKYNIKKADSSESAFSNGVKNSVARDSETRITASDVEAIRSIGRKSINDFTSEDIRKSEKWARKFYQEIGTKSPFFRAWFGDWRAYDTSTASVVTASDTQNKTSGKAKNSDTGMAVSWSSALKAETKNHAVKDRIAVSAANDIASVVQNAIYFYTESSIPTSKSKMPGTVFMHSFYTLYRVGNSTYLLKMYVEEAVSMKDNTVFDRAYQLKDIEKVASVAGGVLSETGGLTEATNATDYSISDLHELVKRYDKDFHPKSVNPALLNDDGTPKVFYHGTSEKFTSFDPEQIAAREGSFFFAENREDAEGYGKYVMEVYLTGENLADYDNQPSEFYKLRDKREQVEYLKERGYDGWYADMDSGGLGEVSVFDPTQIKSATDNIGTFDRGNSDTRNSLSVTDKLWSMGDAASKSTSDVLSALRELDSEARAAKQEFLPDAQTVDEIASSLAEMGLADGVTREDLGEAVQDAADALRALAETRKADTDVLARRRARAAGKLFAAAKMIAPVKGATKAATAEALARVMYETNTVDRKTAKQLVEEYGAIEPGENPYRSVSVPRKTSDTRNVSKTVRTVMEARITTDHMLPTIEDAIESGDFSYEVVTDKAAARARREVRDGYQAALDKYRENVRRGVSSKDNAALGFELYNQAVTTDTEESKKLALDILTDIATSARSNAQALQAMRMIKKMSPDYQLYSVERVVQKMNEDLAKRDQKGATAKKSVEDAILAGQEDAKEAVAKEVGELGNGVPVERWIETVGALVADSVTERLNSKGSAGQKTVPQTMRADLAKAANDLIPTKTSKSKPRSAIDRVSDYFANQAAYDEAWQAAQKNLADKYGENASSLDLLDALLAESRPLSNAEIDKAIKAATREIGASMSEIIRSDAETRDETLRNIERLLIQRGINEADASSASETIAERFAVVTEQASRAALDKILEGKTNTARKTAEQQFADYAAMGAFEGEYNEAMSAKLFGAPIKVNEALAEKFRTATTNAAREEILKDIYRDIGSQIPSTFMEKLTAWRYISMLANPKTHARNIVGNAAFAPVVMLKNKTAALLESAFIKDPNQRTKSFIASNSALVEAANEDFAKLGDAMSDSGKYRDEVDANKYIAEGRKVFGEDGKFGAIGKALNKVRKVNGDLLSYEDTLFKKQYYTYALVSFCKARGITAEQIKSGKGIDAARAYAIREAQRATYNDSNALSNFLSKKSGNVVFDSVISFVQPFMRTPTNILARGLEYSPAGLLKTIVYDSYRLRDGRIAAAEFVDNLSAGLTGSGLLAIGAFLASLGIVKGFDGGDDDDEREFEEMYGHQQYSIEVFGKSITLDWLAPASIPFFTGVNISEALADGGLSWNDVLDVLSLTLDPMMNMSMLQGINGILDSAKYSTNEAIAAIAYQIAENAISQCIPTLFGAVERIAQPDRMTTYVDKNSAVPRVMQRTIGKVSQKIPGWDYNQIPYINAWGEKETSDSVGWRAFDNLANPAYTSSVDETPLEQELILLSKETGETDVFPTRAKSYFNVKRQTGTDPNTGEPVYETERVDLTADQYVAYAQYKGKASKRICDALINTTYYNSASAELKRDMVTRAYSLADSRAKAMVSAYKPTGWAATAIKVCDEYGVTEPQYIALYAMKGDMDGKYAGETVDDLRSARVMYMLYNTTLTDEQRDAVADAFGVSNGVRRWKKKALEKFVKKYEE